MEAQAIVSIAIITVGVTQLLKVLVPALNKGVPAAWATVAVGAASSAVYYAAPFWEAYCTVATAIAVAVLFYDTVYKLFEKKVKAFLGEEGGAETSS